MRITRAAAVVAMLGAVALPAACSNGDDGASDAPTRAADPVTGAPGGTSTSAAPVLESEYAVNAPGRRKDALSYADVLIQDPDPLPASVVERVGDLPGVTSALQISVAQVPLENKLYTIAAVDPATYRLFAPVASADLQEQWDRVAGGEVAADDQLRAKLAIDDDGYVGLRVAGEARRLHVGAWAPQVSGIDLVVNEKVGAALGMPQGNALILSTGKTSPQSLRGPLAAIVGKDLAVQNLDAVTRFGLDPDAYQTAVLVGSFADAVGTFHYTPTGGGRIAPDPAWVSSHIATEVVPILGSVTCNRYLFPQLKAALQEVVTSGLADTINPSQYAGCYYPRFIAGTTTLSNHSFGLALDLNTPGNQRGTVGEMDRGVVAIFKKWGFAWGGDWRYTDPMHFELSRLVRPG